MDATDDERDRIADEHRRWAQGLLHFLSTDEAVPATIRDPLRRYGLPRDEFLDADGWPHQLYVREARRMQGASILTQQDLTTVPHKPDAVGMGGYNIDIREVQWVSAPVSRFPDVFEELQVEGYLSVPVEPWQIPYRALLPAREESEDLVVPICLSASHVAFNGFRLEPQFMIAGEAAGVAAAMAAAARGSVHDVDVADLQRRLLAEGAILSQP